MGATLTAHRLRHTRGGREVLRIETLSVGPGQRLAVLGPNGSGKTTLLRLLAGIDRPTEGTVALDGRTPTSLRVSERRVIGYVTQHPGLLTTSVRRNVELPLAWRGVPRRARNGRVMAALDRLGVAHLADREVHRLSGGERQRINLARSLALDPSVLLLDEPAAALDPEARAVFLDDLAGALADRETTVVHVSHRSEEALRGADMVAVLDSGQLRQLGPPDETFQAPADARVARIVGYHNVVPVEVRAGGTVRLANHDVAVSNTPGTGPAILAVWASGVELSPAVSGQGHACIRAVTAGAGRWEVAVDSEPNLVVHLQADATPPRPGDRVTVGLRSGMYVVLPPPPR